MVTRWGFSETLGAVSYGDNQEEVFLGHSVARTQNVSEDTAQKIDTEVRRLVQGGLDEARRILTERIEDLHALAKALLEFETLTRRGDRQRAQGHPAQARRAGETSGRRVPGSVPLSPCRSRPGSVRPRIPSRREPDSGGPS